MSIAFDVVAGFLRGLSALANTPEMGARGVAISRFLALGALAVERREEGRHAFEKLAADIDVMVAQGRDPTVEELGALRARSDAAHDILQGRVFTADEKKQFDVARNTRVDLRTPAQVTLLEQEKSHLPTAGLPSLNKSTSIPTPGHPGHFQTITPEQQKNEQVAAGVTRSQAMGQQGVHVDSPVVQTPETAAGVARSQGLSQQGGRLTGQTGAPVVGGNVTGHVDPTEGPEPVGPVTADQLTLNQNAAHAIHVDSPPPKTPPDKKVR